MLFDIIDTIITILSYAIRIICVLALLCTVGVYCYYAIFC